MRALLARSLARRGYSAGINPPQKAPCDAPMWANSQWHTAGYAGHGQTGLWSHSAEYSTHNGIQNGHGKWA